MDICLLSTDRAMFQALCRITPARSHLLPGVCTKEWSLQWHLYGSYFLLSLDSSIKIMACGVLVGLASVWESLDGLFFSFFLWLLLDFLFFFEMFHICCIAMLTSFLDFQTSCLPRLIRSRRLLLILLFMVFANANILQHFP